MAIGALINSKEAKYSSDGSDNAYKAATIAIAVTGQAMPYYENENELRNVWIGIAMYCNEDGGILGMDEIDRNEVDRLNIFVHVDFFGANI